ncbi:hypothetical protein [Geoglobus acetivorans]|uniref:VCBS repeat-containing protein n=1 Tax=Geoglobus acetivorans TaxID=565033 RepID=A0A0A7GGJ1_GEOAI|nr:hypothetical protein GACE_1917 [Geoglobus acetivorans]
MKSEWPVVGLEKVNATAYLMVSMKSFLVEDDDSISVNWGEGRLSTFELIPQDSGMNVLWNYTLEGYRIFSYPCVSNGHVYVAVTGSPNVHEHSELIEITPDGRIREIAELEEFVLKVARMSDGTLILTGFDVKTGTGKVVLIKGTKKIFERSMGNRVLGSLVHDLDGDGAEDFIVAGVVFENHTKSIISVFLNRSGSFVEDGRFELLNENIWGIILAKFEGEEAILLYGPKSIYLLDLSDASVAKLYEAKEGYYLTPVEVDDSDGDGQDEVFAVIHNETGNFFTGLEYVNGRMQEKIEFPLNAKAFSILSLGSRSFLLGSSDGLYLLRLPE